MIGLDFPVKSDWIHAVHHLWQPEQPISELVQTALDQTMPELGGEKSRRNSLSIILRYFVATTGAGQSRRTAAQDVWVAHSRIYPAGTMAPAYLSHLIAQNELAGEISRFAARRYVPGDTFSSGDIRQHVSAVYGQRKVVTNAASAFLRTLDSFSVLDPGRRQGEYQFLTRLPVTREVFPLLVWSWWQAHRSPQIDLDEFAATPALAFLQTDDLSNYWPAYPSLWSLDERLEGRRATLKYVEPEFFQAALFDLLPT